MNTFGIKVFGERNEVLLRLATYKLFIVFTRVAF